ncbi:response regulator [uncultured Shimia sp.]|uniref:response regulator n=1 Tax=uncultured Shimia sp. TaxID=573152 RepID=UPI00261A0A1C|nr:response regulator [uncultured Shimia sp.]
MPLQGIRARLLVTFLLASVLPLALGGLVFYRLVNQTITTETFEKVAFARDAKASEIAQYMTYASRQAENLAQSANVRYSVGEFYGFSHALRQMDGSPEEAGAQLRNIFGVDSASGGRSDGEAEDRLLREALEYSNTHRRFHADFLDFLREAEFDNLYLADRHGQVVYSVHKDAYLGRPLNQRVIGLGQAYFKVTSGEEFGPVFQDFAVDAITGELAAYLAVPVRLHGSHKGAMILRIPPNSLEGLVTESEAELSVLSSGGIVIASNGAPVAGEPVRMPKQMKSPEGVAVLEAGLSGGASLSAWRILDEPFPQWTVVAETSRDAAFQNSDRLRETLLVIGAAAAVGLSFLSFVFSSAITRPVRRMSEAASAVATGSLNDALPEYDRPVEYARLSRAVNQMRRALRDQLDLIRDKNDELQEKLREIGEKNAELEEADRMKDRFLANTSHELRTPLNGIIGILETLEGGAMGDMLPAQASQLRLITFSARRLSRLVDDLLDIYRIREGRMRLDLQPVDVSQAAHSVVQLLQPTFQVDLAKFHIDLPEDLPAVYADPVRFEQILFNLLSNAVKYGAGSDVEITAQVAGNDQMVVSIRDHGPGIAEDSMERIFHPLEQLTPDGSGQATGTGLGLTIARHLANLMSGSIEVSSTQGDGAEFRVLLPVTDQMPISLPEDLLPAEFAAAAVPRPDMEQAGIAAPEGSPLILAVDDEPINLQVLQNLLVPQGYRVITAHNGSEALRCVAEKRPDLIVLDVMMTGLSGLDVARDLRRRHRLHELPIILLTARGRTSDMLAGFDAGANDYVVKPFAKDELLSRIRTLLEASRARSSAAENRELKEEIERRIQIEDALRLSQRRMAQLLDTLDDGLICVNARGLITYANEAGQKVLDKPVTVNKSRLKDVLPEDILAPLEQTEVEDEPIHIEVMQRGRAHQVSLFAMLPEAGGGRAVLFTPGPTPKAQFVNSLRDVVDTSLPSLMSQNEEEAGGCSAGDRYRETIVALMSDSLEIWGAATGKSKIDFAEASGIWRVNLDKTSLQTRTLDKYLLIETLPDNPRWRDVLKTVKFVLALKERGTSGGDIGVRFEVLEKRLEEFRALIDQRD